MPINLPASSAAVHWRHRRRHPGRRAAVTLAWLSVPFVAGIAALGGVDPLLGSGVVLFALLLLWSTWASRNVLRGRPARGVALLVPALLAVDVVAFFVATFLEILDLHDSRTETTRAMVALGSAALAVVAAVTVAIVVCRHPPLRRIGAAFALSGCFFVGVHVVVALAMSSASSARFVGKEGIVDILDLGDRTVIRLQRDGREEVCVHEDRLSVERAEVHRSNLDLWSADGKRVLHGYLPWRVKSRMPVQEFVRWVSNAP